MRFPPIARPSVRGGAELVLGVALLLSVLWLRHQRDAARRELGQLALRADTLIATADTTRQLANAAIALAIGDSAAVFQRQIIQVTQRADALDRALGLERIAKTALAAKVRDLETHTTGTVTTDNASDTATRRATFAGRDVPYTYRAEVTLPAPPASGRLALHVSIDSIPLELRPGCAAPNADGIRSAFVTVTAPAWAPVKIGRVEQDPAVCRSPALEPAHGDARAWWRKLVERAGISAGYGATIAADGRIYHGPAIVAGVKLWP